MESPEAQYELEQRKYPKCAQRFSVSHMSNAKWRRVFHAIAEAGITDLRSDWKHIDSDFITVHDHLPRHNDVLESRFNDGYFQPYEYKWIEWIRFPRSYFSARHGLTRKQDLSLLETVLARCGAVKVVATEENVTLIAYEAPITA